MGRKCEVCNKRKAKHIINVYISAGVEQVKEMCWACSRRYMKLREKHLVMAFNELILPYAGSI